MLKDMFKIIEFDKFGDEKGSLVVIEGEKMGVPFDIKRVFFIYVDDLGDVRGNHANRHTELVLVCASGSCKVKLLDGRDEEIVSLNDSKKGLYIAPMCWKEMYDFEPNTVLLVIASEHYSENEYIRDMEEYKKEMEMFWD